MKYLLRYSECQGFIIAFVAIYRKKKLARPDIWYSLITLLLLWSISLRSRDSKTLLQVVERHYFILL